MRLTARLNRLTRVWDYLMAAPTAGAPRPQLFLEAMEDRSVPATISGHVFEDANLNGVYDAGDAPLAGIQVRLINNNVPPDPLNPEFIGPVTTGSDGSYQFTGIPRGSWVVQARTSSGVNVWDGFPPYPGRLRLGGGGPRGRAEPDHHDRDRAARAGGGIGSADHPRGPGFSPLRAGAVHCRRGRPVGSERE
jgi:hypothetical protein